MQKSLVVFLICLAVLPIASAITIDEVLLNSTGLNTTINISTQVNLSEFIVDTDTIYFGNVNYSNPTQVSTEPISYNITTENKTYTALDLPYISQSNTGQKTIVSNIDGTVDGDMTVVVNSCFVDFLRFDFVGTAHDTTLNSSFWTCSANVMTFNYTGIGKGTNYIWAVGDIVATNCTERSGDIDDQNNITMLNTAVSFGDADATACSVYNLYNATDSTQVVDVGNYTVNLCTVTLDDETYWNKTIVTVNYSKSTTQNVTLWFSVYDEDSPSTPLIADAEVELNYWMANASIYVRNFTLDYSGNSTYGICLSNNVTKLQADLYIKYTTANGFTHRYILANNTLTVADVQTISIFNFNTTDDISDLKITTRYNSNYNYYPNIITKLQRRYTAEGVWRTVQMDKSGDFGLNFFNIREEIVDYRLIFTDMSNNILRTTETVKFVCSSGVCDLTILLDPFSATAGTSGLAITYSYSNDTGIINVDWTDSLAGTNTVVFAARQDTVTGLNYLCNQTQTGAAGSMNCDLTGRSGVVEIHIIGNDNIIIHDLLDVTATKLGNLIGDGEGAIWAVIIIVTCAMFGLFSPVASIIAMFIGLIGIFLLGIFTPITVTFLIIAAVIGIVIGFKVRN